MKRKPLIAGNWKMFKTEADAVVTALRLSELSCDVQDTDIMVAPTFLSIPLLNQELRNTNVKIGAQNLFYEKQGAYTGEVSAYMLKDAGADYVIIGHSERRQLFGETDDSICKKIKAAIDVNLIPIMCIGETENEKIDKKTFNVLDKQIKNGLKGFCSENLHTLVLAYEPVWAIGTGLSATPEQVNEVHHYLRSLIEEMFGKDIANSIRILYGGSVKPENVAKLMSLKDVDGALVGGASLDADEFIKIVEFDKN